MTEAEGLGQVGKRATDELGAIVGDDKLHAGGDEGTQRLDYHLAGDMHTRREEREPQALTGAVVHDHQDGQPALGWLDRGDEGCTTAP